MSSAHRDAITASALAPACTSVGRFTTSRRRLLGAAVLPSVLSGVPAGALALSAGREGRARVKPVTTTLADWADVRGVLGQPGDMRRFIYHTAFPRRDLRVFSRGILIKPALALGTHVSFVRYADGSTLLMGDIVVTEGELQTFCDLLHRHGITQSALHKHLLAHEPDVWWVHARAVGGPLSAATVASSSSSCTTIISPRNHACSSSTTGPSAMPCGSPGPYARPWTPPMSYPWRALDRGWHHSGGAASGIGNRGIGRAPAPHAARSLQRAATPPGQKGLRPHLADSTRLGHYRGSDLPLHERLWREPPEETHGRYLHQLGAAL